MQKTHLWMERVAYYSLVIIALAVFTSLSVSALHHILLIVPGIYFLRKNPKDWSVSMWAVLAIVATIFLSIVFNVDELARPLKNLTSAKYFLLPLLGVFAYRAVEWTPKRIRIALNGFLLATTVASLCGLIGLYSGYTPLKMKAACHAERACGLYGMYMTYGYGMGLFMVLMTGLVLYRDQLKGYVWNWLLWTSLVVNGFGLFFSYARGAWLGFLIALPFFFAKKNKKLFLGILLTGVIALSGAISFSPTINRMFLDRQGSNEQRLAFFETAWMAFKERPFVGWGYKNFEPNVKALKAKYEISFPDFQGHAHNNFLEHLASTGILGLLALVVFHFAWFIESWHGRGLIANLAMPFVVALTISGMTQVTLGDGENLFLIMTFWILCQIKGRKTA